MSDIVELSLADLAGIDVSEVDILQGGGLPTGAYLFEVKSGILMESQKRDTMERQFVVEFGLEVVECYSVTVRNGPDKESLVGRKHTERRYIDGVDQSKLVEGIGYLRGFLENIGAESAGPLGGVEGSSGVIDGAVGVRFPGKIVEQKDRNDPTRVYSRLVVEPKKKESK